MDNGQVHVILIRREAKKESALPALQFTESREVGYLATLTRDKGPKGVIPLTSPKKLAQRRKQVTTKMGCKRRRDKCFK